MPEESAEQPFNPFDAGEPMRVFPRLHRLRQEGPVVGIGEGMWYVTRYEEAREVLRDTESFSNAAGFRAPGVEVPPEDRMLGEQDPPQHPRVRRVVMTAFNPAAVKQLEPFVRERATQLLDGASGAREVDLVAAFTVPLPNDATVKLLGFPMEDSGRIATWSKEVMESEWPAMNRTDRGEGMAGAFPEYTAYVDVHIEQVRRQVDAGTPPDDLIARLVTADLGGQALGHRQLRALVFNLLLGGLTTTSQLLGNLIYEALNADRVADLLAGGAATQARFIEECLRIYPPVLFIPRGCVKDVTVGGVTIGAGERVIVGTACANRDEGTFTDSEELVVDRENAERHLTFGFGAHLCAGAAMARLVGGVGLESFLTFADRHGARLAPGFSYENVPTYFEYGPNRLPVTLTR